MSGQTASVAQGGTARPLQVGAALAGIVLAAVLLFSLGVMTGSRIAGRSPGAPAGPPPPEAMAVPVAPAPVAPPAAVPAGGPAPGPVPAGSLTFYDRLSGAATPPPPVQSGEPLAREAGGTAAPPAAPAAPSATAAERSGATLPAGDDTGARVRKLMGKGPFAVQVAAVADRAAAAAATERLRRLGLPAATVAATAKGRTWYRLRVGSFPSREAAAPAAGRRHAEMGLDATPVRD